VGEATIVVPAAEPGRVWLIDFPGEQVGAGRARVRLAEVAGQVFLDVPGPDELTGGPAIGVPGGLAVGGSGADRILLELERANAFVVALDAGRKMVSLPPPSGSDQRRAVRPRPNRASWRPGTSRIGAVREDRASR